MKEENKLALIVAFYLSKFDVLAYESLGFGGSVSTHKTIGDILDVKANTIKNMRDEFDPLHDNPRKGWHQRELTGSREEVAKQYKNYTEKELLALVQKTLRPSSYDQKIFNDIEEDEIDTKERNLIEGDVLERKVLAYERNTRAVRLCKERDQYTCQVCNFFYNNQIVECHHIEPLSMIKAGNVSLDNLITLCPTCHRIAHSLIQENYDRYTNKEILTKTMKQIREIL